MDQFPSRHLASYSHRLPPGLEPGLGAIDRSNMQDLRGNGQERGIPYGALLRRRWWVIAVATILVGGLAGYIASRQTPHYEARAALEVQGVNSNVLNASELDPSAVADNSSQSYINTQARILQSQPVIQRTVDRMAPTLGSRKLTTAEVARDLKIRTNETNRIVEVVYEDSDPNVAASVANTLAQEYISEDLDSRWRSTQRTGEWLGRQMEDLKAKLRQSETALQDYTASSGLLFVGGDNNVADMRLRELQSELSKAEADRVQKESLYRQLRDADPAQKVLPTDSLLEENQIRLADLRRQLADLEATYAPNYYKVRNLKAQIAEVERAGKGRSETVQSRVGSDFATAKRREDMLAAAYATQSKAVSDQATKLVNYNFLKREVQTNREIYETMLQRVKGFSIASALRASNVRLIDPATPPMLPSRPKPGLAAAIGGMSGMFLALLWVLLKGQRDKSIQEPGESGFYLRVPELGVIPSAKTDPAIPRSSLTRMLNGKRMDGHADSMMPSSELEVVSWHRKPSLMTESFRSVVTSLLLSGGGIRGSRIIVVSSLNPSEGKTTIASNLAIVLSEFQSRVLVIDGDRRRPRMQEVFGCEGRTGLCDVLQSARSIGSYSLDELVRPTSAPNVWVMPSGRHTPEVSSHLYSQRMAELLARFRNEFDTVIIDTPPLLYLADARLIGRLSDGIVMVFRAGQSRWDDAQVLQQRLAEDNVPILGSILNDWDPKTSGRSYGNRARYAYSAS